MGKRIACVTLDIEPDIGDHKRQLRMFQDDTLANRYIDIVRRQNVKVTGYVVTSLLREYGTAFRQLGERVPIEFDLHSHTHDHKSACSRDEIEKALYTYQAFWGTTPLGYRAPYGLIDRSGVGSLLDLGFQYDSSIFPSVRLGKYHYWNLDLPSEPFQFVRGQESLVELPFAGLRMIRLVFSLSRVKLLGMDIYRLLIKLFSLPDIVILDSHPYDFYVPLIAKNIEGWEKLAHLRNGGKAFELFEWIIEMLRMQGYQFMYMSELCRHVQNWPGMAQVDVNKWN
jgi:peptidoglycan/xylan/chitin deacetylase (PgdA/CDA1 family)